MPRSRGMGSARKPSLDRRSGPSISPKSKKAQPFSGIEAFDTSRSRAIRSGQERGNRAALWPHCTGMVAAKGPAGSGPRDCPRGLSARVVVKGPVTLSVMRTQTASGPDEGLEHEMGMAGSALVMKTCQTTKGKEGEERNTRLGCHPTQPICQKTDQRGVL